MAVTSPSSRKSKMSRFSVRVIPFHTENGGRQAPADRPAARVRENTFRWGTGGPPVRPFTPGWKSFCIGCKQLLSQQLEIANEALGFFPDNPVGISLRQISLHTFTAAGVDGENAVLVEEDIVAFH